jgi:hypothetical protein
VPNVTRGRLCSGWQALITSLALATAALSAATDSGAPRDSRVGLTGERLEARLAQQQLLGSKRLRLLPYTQGAEAAGPEIKGLRFESWVDVWGKAPRDPNEAISGFLKDPDRAIYRGAPPSADFVPLIEWVAKKIKNMIEKKPSQESQ